MAFAVTLAGVVAGCDRPACDTAESAPSPADKAPFLTLRFLLGTQVHDVFPQAAGVTEFGVASEGVVGRAVFETPIRMRWRPGSLERG